MQQLNDISLANEEGNQHFSVQTKARGQQFSISTTRPERNVFILMTNRLNFSEKRTTLVDTFVVLWAAVCRFSPSCLTADAPARSHPSFAGAYVFRDRRRGWQQDFLFAS